MMELKHLDVFQTGKVLAAIYTFFGVISLVFSLYIKIISIVDSGQSHSSPLPLFSILFFPLMGFIYGILIAVFYNIIAKWIGGFRFTLGYTEEIPNKVL